MKRKRIVILFVALVLGVLALALVSMPMRAQNQGYPFPGYPPEMSPLRTFRLLQRSNHLCRQPSS